MNQVSFTGSFLLKKPNETAYNEFKDKVLPKSKSVVVPDVFEQGNVLVAVKNPYDRAIGEYLLKKSVDFAYYPKTGLKRKFNPRDPKSAEVILNKEKHVIKDKEVIKAYLENMEYSDKPIEYRWEPDDHIDKTLNALNLSRKDCTITNIDNVLSVYSDKENFRLIVKASPNNDRGDNFVYLYPTTSKTIIAKINYEGNIEFYEFKKGLENFQWHFCNAVKIDRGRLRPAKKV